MRVAPGTEAAQLHTWGAWVLKAVCELLGNMRAKEISDVFLRHRTGTSKLAGRWSGARQAIKRVMTREIGTRSTEEGMMEEINNLEWRGERQIIKEKAQSLIAGCSCSPSNYFFQTIFK